MDLGMTTKHSMAENDMSVQLPHTMEVAANKGWEMQDPSVAVKLEALWIVIVFVGQRKDQAERFRGNRFDRVYNP